MLQIRLIGIQENQQTGMDVKKIVLIYVNTNINIF